MEQKVDRKLKIVCLNDDEGKDGVTFYRALQPMRYLKSKGHNVLFKSDIQEKDGSVKPDIMIDADIVWMASPNSPLVQKMLNSIVKTNIEESLLVRMGTPKEKMVAAGFSTKLLNVIIDYDDDLFTHNPTNRAYLMRGRKEVSVMKSGKREYLWKDGKEYPTLEGFMKKFSTKENYENIITQLQMLGGCDMFTTPSTKLLKRLGRFVVGNKYMLSNAVDFDKFKNIPKQMKSPGAHRLLWTLSASHLYEWLHIYPILGKIMKQYPELTLVTVGAKFPVSRRQLPLSQWEHHKWVDIDKYPEFLSNLNCDLSLAYVKADRFNHYKSPLKWEEASAMGMYTLYSKYLYGDYVPNDCGGVYSNDTEFTELLTNICEGKIDIRRDAQNAYYYVLQNYGLKIVGDQLETKLLELTEGNNFYEAEIQA